MSLFDLQDVCMAIGSLATLDLPMVVDLIGVYGLKGPYRTLTTTDWFLQALSVIPRGSWGDVARRFTMIRWVAQNRRPSSLKQTAAAAAAAAADLRRKFVSGQFDEENPFVQNSSVLLVQPDEGVSVLVMDRIGDYLPQSTEKSRVLVIPVGARHKCQQADLHHPELSSYAVNCSMQTTSQLQDLVSIINLEKLQSQELMRGDKLKDDLSSEITDNRLMLQKQSAEINSSLASHSSQLAEIVAHIRRAGDVKKREGNPGFTAGRGFNPADGSPGGG
ncbi:hypothetical protein F511_34232 [Dorcoceras hygrometricum]|uniref:Uncharacterized protein n=1 Tax=Dorcoceras hygrometricum TaxID=472368 RepID=A0A2Z7BT16_9LAMI|nr:hypothetical protein F511_34232 [Dorcoceras hygrometricum]